MNDAGKLSLKKKHAKQIIGQTIRDLKKQGATNCKASVETRIYARVGFTDDEGKRHDRVRAATNRSEARDLIRDILRDLEEERSSKKKEPKPSIPIVLRSYPIIAPKPGRLLNSFPSLVSFKPTRHADWFSQPN